MRVLVGIFSREGEESYKWLTDLLISYQNVDVRPVVISNSQFPMDEINKCDVAVLYHSQKRGRINVTDVTDALYDEELKLLSESLGKENVVVVIDDLTDPDPELKERILQHQPSIGALAVQLILVRAEEKTSESLASDDFRNNKMKEIKDIIKREKKASSHISVLIGNLMSDKSRKNIIDFLKNYGIMIFGFIVILVIVAVVSSRYRYTENWRTTAGYPTTSNMPTTWHPETSTSSLPKTTHHPTNFTSVDTTPNPGNGTQESPTSTFHAKNISLSP